MGLYLVLVTYFGIAAYTATRKAVQNALAARKVAP